MNEQSSPPSYSDAPPPPSIPAPTFFETLPDAAPHQPAFTPVPPAPIRKKVVKERNSPGILGSILILLFTTVIGAGGAIAYTVKTGEVPLLSLLGMGEKKAEEPQSAPAQPVVTSAPQAAPAPVTQAAAAPATTVSDLIDLQSTDGRAIRAKILVISDASVFIRREDGQTFDLPFARLTQESKDKIEEYRLSRIYKSN